MAISKEQKQLFNERVKPYKETLEEVRKEASTLKAAARKDQKLAPYFLVKQAILAMKSSNILVEMAELSAQIQNLKNDKYIGDARKELANSLNDLVKELGEHIDIGLTENEETLAKIDQMNPARLLQFMNGYRESLQTLKIAVGNGKWRWYFPELHYKLTTLALNVTDFKAYEKAKDSNAPYFVERQEFMKFLIEEAHTAAQEYRSKYELSTQDVSDLQQIQKLFELLKKLYTFTNNKEELEKLSISLESNKARIETIMAEKKKGGKKK